MDQIMDNGTVLIFPTVPGVAPMREGRSEEEVQAWRMKTFQLLAIASFCGLPQVAIPLRIDAEGPRSVSLLGGFQTDKMLLECAFRYSAQMQEHFPNYVITEMMKSNPAPKSRRRGESEWKQSVCGRQIRRRDIVVRQSARKEKSYLILR